MDVGDISWSRGGDRQKEKDAILLDAPGVTRLVDVRCHRDPEWSLELLERAAPSLQELSVHHPREAHLLAVHAMPRLRRLHVTSVPLLEEHYSSHNHTQLPALPPGHAGLQWLRVWGLPCETLASLLRAHRESLEELQLSVGTAEPLVEVAARAVVREKSSEWASAPSRRSGLGWPYSCNELGGLLGGPWSDHWSLRALRRLVLERSSVFHDRAHCVRQLAQVRPLLSGAEVLCDECNGVAGEEL